MITLEFMLETLESLGFNEIEQKRYAKEIESVGRKYILVVMPFINMTVFAIYNNKLEVRRDWANYWPLSVSHIILPINLNDKILAQRYESVLKAMINDFFLILHIGYEFLSGPKDKRYTEIHFDNPSHTEHETIYYIIALSYIHGIGRPGLSNLRGLIYEDINKVNAMLINDG